MKLNKSLQLESETKYDYPYFEIENLEEIY
jgi:hypothetical protein